VPANLCCGECCSRRCLQKECARVRAALDACNEACQRAVCTNLHQVPAWNDACLKRCTAECLRGRAS